MQYLLHIDIERPISKDHSWHRGRAVMEFAETMAFIGLQIDLVLYLINKMNFAHTKAATTVTNFAGTAFLCPLFGGFLADAYLGRVSVVVIFGCVELVVKPRTFSSPPFVQLSFVLEANWSEDS